MPTTFPNDFDGLTGPLIDNHHAFVIDSASRAIAGHFDFLRKSKFSPYFKSKFYL